MKRIITISLLAVSSAALATGAVLLGFIDFDLYREQFQQGQRQTAVDREPCDLNWDGRCDSTDLRMFEAVFGHCDTDGSGIIPEADMDRDGCITEADREALFPESGKAGKDTQDHN